MGCLSLGRVGGVGSTSMEEVGVSVVGVGKEGVVVMAGGRELG